MKTGELAGFLRGLAAGMDSKIAKDSLSYAATRLQDYEAMLQAIINDHQTFDQAKSRVSNILKNHGDMNSTWKGE
jgi:hypothetical protein